jgi:hypothetical protein
MGGVDIPKSRLKQLGSGLKELFAHKKELDACKFDLSVNTRNCETTDQMRHIRFCGKILSKCAAGAAHFLPKVICSSCSEPTFLAKYHVILWQLFKRAANLATGRSILWPIIPAARQ